MENSALSSILSPILSTEKMRALDAAAKKNGNKDEIRNGYEMMKLAGFALFEKVKELQKKVLNKSIAIFIGGGNNGGDGLVLAKLLKEANIPHTVYSLHSEEKFKNEARLAFIDFIGNGGRLIYVNEGFSSKPSHTLIVDCMLGNGASGELRTNFAEIVNQINSWSIPILAADAPTGYDSSLHKVNDICIKANETLLFGLPRLDAYTKSGSNVFGNISTAPLSYPQNLIENFSEGIYLAKAENIPYLLPKRDEWSEKRDNGCAMIIAGSAYMTGAATLCTQAALRCGAGLVTLATPKTVLPIQQAKMSEPIFLGLSDNANGYLQTADIPLLLKGAQHNNAIALGPGISTEKNVQETVLEILPQITKPIVIDADALNAIATKPSILQSISAPAIVTPHKREYSRIFGEIPQNDFDIPAQLRKNAQDTNKVIILKGATTWIATPDGKVYVVSTANSGMAKGGSGDVLTGILVSFLAQGMAIDIAAVLGVLIHQKAGTIARNMLGPYSMLPSDIIQSLSKAFA